MNKLTVMMSIMRQRTIIHSFTLNVFDDPDMDELNMLFHRLLRCSFVACFYFFFEVERLKQLHVRYTNRIMLLQAIYVRVLRIYDHISVIISKLYFQIFPTVFYCFVGNYSRFFQLSLKDSDRIAGKIWKLNPGIIPTISFTVYQNFQ